MQRWVAAPMVEQEGHSVCEDLAQQPAGQVPKVFGPHSLDGVSSGELRKDGVYPVAKSAQIRAPLRRRIVLFGAVGSEQRDAHAPGQLFPPLQASSNCDPRRRSREWTQAVRGARKARGRLQELPRCGYDARPAHPHMHPLHPEAVEGLLEKRVLAESGFSFEAMAAVGAGEQTRRQGHRVYEREGRIVRGQGEELLAELLLELPEICCLPGEGGAMHFGEGREPLTVMTPEVTKEDRLVVGVESQELPDDLLDGEDLSASESLGAGPRWRMRRPLSRSSMRQKTATMKVLRSTGRDLLFASIGLGTTERKEVSFVIQPFGKTCTPG